jgi:hypothetical protein
MPKEIFSTRHTDNSAIRVIAGRDAGDGSSGLDIVVNGIVRARVYSPEAVTQWFLGNSSANTEKWRTAYHVSGLGPDYFKLPASTNIDLRVPYLSQRDNELRPLGTCNVTCYAMALSYLGAKRRARDSQRQFEDELFKFLERNGRDRHVHDDLAWMGRQYGVDASFSTRRTWAQVTAELQAGNPVVVSTKLTSSGHIILIRGRNEQGFIVNDPFGNALAKYKDRNGNGLVYPFKLMEDKVRGDKPFLWGHFLRRIA